MVLINLDLLPSPRVQIKGDGRDAAMALAFTVLAWLLIVALYLFLLRRG